MIPVLPDPMHVPIVIPCLSSQNTTVGYHFPCPWVPSVSLMAIPDHLNTEFTVILG